MTLDHDVQLRKPGTSALVASADDGSTSLRFRGPFQVVEIVVSKAGGHRSRYRWYWRVGWALILAVALTLKFLQAPLYSFGYGEDDELFVRMAKGFLEGHWSSDWATTGVVTMAKPVGYPLLLAGAHYLPWTPVFTVYCLYLVGAALIAWSWNRISRSRIQVTLILAALAFHPIYFATSSQRIYRDNFINAIATMAIGLSFVIAVHFGTSRATEWSHQRTVDSTADTPRRSRIATALRMSYLYVLSFLIGLAIGVAVITKPTWQWLLLAVVAPLTYPIVRRIRIRERRWAVVLRMSLAGLIMMVGAYAVVASTTAMNRRTYHVALVEDLSSGALARAWKVWASVEAGPPVRDVAITEAMRRSVYEVSPAAAKLKPFLESPHDFWKTVDCESPLRICNDSGPWFEWDLRFAAVSANQVRSVHDIQTYFGRVADEISSACASGRLRCSSSPVLATGLPTLNQIPVISVASYTARGLWQMVTLNLPVGPPDSPNVTPAEYAYWKTVVPGMSSLSNVTHGSTPEWVYSFLRSTGSVFGAGNIAFLAIAVLGPLAWLARRLVTRQKAARRADWRAATTSILFFLSTLLGMMTLAVFAAAVGGLGFTGPIYWTDFATPAELCLVIGAFASWPVLRHAVGNPPRVRRRT